MKYSIILFTAALTLPIGSNAFAGGFNAGAFTQGFADGWNGNPTRDYGSAYRAPCGLQDNGYGGFNGTGACRRFRLAV